MDEISLESIIGRMPLAEAVLLNWRWVFDEERLQNLWSNFRGRCYEKVISFATMTHLVVDALLQYQGSGRRSFEKNIESGQLSASVAAAFGKLSRLPIRLSQGLLEEGTVALRELFPVSAVRKLPDSLSAFQVLLVDGKAIKNVAKRLKPLRQASGGLLGGKAVVALEWNTGFVVGLQAHPDGDASEKRLVGELTSRLSTVVMGPRLFVADRGFCDLVQARHFTAVAGDRFLVRHHRGTTFTPDPSQPGQRGTDHQGRPYEQNWGWLGSESNKGRRYVRMIRLFRPDAEEDLVVVTDLLSATQYPAADVLWLYHERWGIERVFQRVTEVFGLERLIGGTPQACVFQFAFCLLLYNIIQVLTGYVAHGQQCDPEEISKEKLFDDVEQQMVAWSVLFTPEQTFAYFQQLPSAAKVRERLRQVLGTSWSDTWRKASPQKRQPPSPRPRQRCHGSVYRILKDYVPKPPPKVARVT